MRKRLLALFPVAFLAGCSTPVAPCTGVDAIERALATFGVRRWESLTGTEVKAAWPGPLVREEAAAAFGADGAPVPYELWLRTERLDRLGCLCCQTLELGAGADGGLVLRVVSVHAFAPTWADASRTAARLLLAGLPPDVSVRLTLPPVAPSPSALPWLTSAPWASPPDPDGRTQTGTALVEIDSGGEGWVVLVRHQRPYHGPPAARPRP